MWIRSQDKERLLKVNYVLVSGTSIEAIHDEFDYTTIGDYSTKEKALKVLDMIQQRIETNETSGYYTVFQMPEDIKRIGNETNNTNSTI